MLGLLPMNRRDLAIVVVSSAFLGLVLFRLMATPAPPTRRLSVEALEIKSQAVRSGESLTHEASWLPPDDVFIVGWAPELGAPAARPELYLLCGETRIFAAPRGAVEGMPTLFLPAGTGFLIRKGEPVTLRLRLDNLGPDGETRGARALIYFHPVAWR
jgi:hypothetical protein